MATSATAFQWPIGTLPCSARKAQVRHTQARVQDVWSRARAISVSSSVCIVRNRAWVPAVATVLVAGSHSKQSSGYAPDVFYP